MTAQADRRNASTRPGSEGGPEGAGLLLRRKCACGKPTSALTGECEDCKKKRLQSKLAVGATNDPLESEAEQAADRALTGEVGELSGSGPSVQRDGGGPGAQAAPASVERALAGSGNALEPGLCSDMGRRFGHDFSRVRVHSGAAAEESARDVDANAYTVGHHIVFGAAQFAPRTEPGRRLLAHELAHVVQQGAGGSILRAQPKKKAKAKTAPAKKAKPPQICGRDSRKVAGNSITKVNIDVGANTLTIEWADPKTAPAMSAGTHAISPGSGLCCVDCNDATVSQTSGSLCTPKGGSWPVDHTGCALGGHPSAKNPTYFQRGGVAIHSGNTSSPPQSHGCARTSLDISELIHDNVVPDVTQIASSGTWAGTKCYLKESSDTLSNRKDVCDGNKLKPKSSGKKGGKKAAPKGGANAPEDVPEKKTPPPAPPPAKTTVPVAEGGDFDEAGEQPVLLADGPGPNNDPPSRETLGDLPLADIDPEGDADGGAEGGGREVDVA